MKKKVVYSSVIDVDGDTGGSDRSEDGVGGDNNRGRSLDDDHDAEGATKHNIKDSLDNPNGSNLVGKPGWRHPVGGRRHLLPTEDYFEDEDNNDGGQVASETSGDIDESNRNRNNIKSLGVAHNLRRRSVIKQQQDGLVEESIRAVEDLGITIEEMSEKDSPIENGQADKVAPTVYIFAACAALNSSIIGYDLGITSLSVLLIQESLQLSDLQIESYVGIMGFFAILGAGTASLGTNTMGRKGAFVVASVGFIVGDMIQGTAQSYETLMIGRSVLGVAVGYGLAIDPIYISEIAPKEKRGELVSWSEIAINAGVVFGFSAGIIFYHVPDDVAWRYMFGTGALLPFTMLLLVKFVMPESPRWLIQQRREEEATHVLAKLNPDDHDGSQVETLVHAIKESLEQEEAQHEFGWVFLLFTPTPAYRRMLWTGVLAGISQQVVGIDGIGSFLATTLDRAGIHDRFWLALTLIGIQTMKTVITIGAAKQVDRRGRRLLCFISLAGMTASLIVLAADFALSTGTSSVTILGLLGYMSFFGVGMGPCAWLIPAEVFTTSVRSKGMSLATLSNRLVATTWASTFLSMEKAITWAGVFLVMAGLCIVMIILIYFYVPETKGKSLEEMAEFFAKITGDRSILDEMEAPDGPRTSASNIERRKSSSLSKPSVDRTPSVDHSIEMRTIV